MKKKFFQGISPQSIIVGIFLIFGLSTNYAHAGYSFNSGTQGVITFTTNSNTELQQFGAGNKIGAENPVTGNGLIWFNVYDNSGALLASHWNSWTVSNWTADAPPPSENDSLSSATAGSLVVDSVETYGLKILTILGYFIGFLVGYLIFKFGMRKLKNVIR